MYFESVLFMVNSTSSCFLRGSHLRKMGGVIAVIEYHQGGDGGMQLAAESLPSQNRIQRIWEAFPRIFYLFHLLTLGLFLEQDESPQFAAVA